MFFKKKKFTIFSRKLSALIISVSLLASVLVNGYDLTIADEFSTTDEIHSTENITFNDNADLNQDEDISEGADNQEPLATEESEVSEDTLEDPNNQEPLTTEESEIDEDIWEDILEDIPVETEILETPSVPTKNTRTNEDINATPETLDEFYTLMEELEVETTNKINVNIDLSKLTDRTITLKKCVNFNMMISNLTFIGSDDIILISASGDRHFNFTNYLTQASIQNFDFGGMTLSGGNQSESGGICTKKYNYYKYNLTIDNVTITNCSNLKGNAIELFQCNVTLKSGVTLTNNHNENALGGAIHMDTAILTTSANITNNTAKYGGAFFYQSYYTNDLYINDCTISGNTAIESGGAICALTPSSTTEITNTTLDGNTSINGSGGAIYTDCYLGATNTNIINNTAINGSGGGIYFFNSHPTGSPYLRVRSGCYITNNKAPNGNGGGLYSEGNTAFSLTDLSSPPTHFSKNSAKNGGAAYLATHFASFVSVMTENEATENGGAIYSTVLNKPGNPNSGDGIFLVNYGSILDNNKAGNNGGAVYLKNIYLEIVTSTISNNKAENHGGAVYGINDNLDGSKPYKFENALFQKNEALNGSGGAIYSENINFNIPPTINGGSKNTTTLNNNAANLDGGAISANNCNLNISNTTIKNNTTKTDGGAISANNCILNIYTSTIENNTAEMNGGAFYSNDTVVDIEEYPIPKTYSYFSDTKINNNTAINGNGGAIYTNMITDITNYSSVSDNKAINGGGIYFYTSPSLNFEYPHDYFPLTIEDSTMKDNTATNDGGAIYTFGNTVANLVAYLELRNATIINNKALNGGGVYLKDAASIYICRSNVSNNQAIFDPNVDNTGYGGGVYADVVPVLYTTSKDIVSNIFMGPHYRWTDDSTNTISDNKADINGGAFAINDKTLLILEHGDIKNNTAGYNGGAIGLIHSSSNLNVDNIILGPQKPMENFYLNFSKNTTNKDFDLNIPDVSEETEEIMKKILNEYGSTLNTVYNSDKYTSILNDSVEFENYSNYYKKYNDKINDINNNNGATDNRFVVTDNSLGHVFNNDDIQIELSTIKPLWKSDTDKWYKEENLGMNYKDINHSIIMFDFTELGDNVSSTTVMDMIKLNSKIDKPYKFSSSGVYKGHIYGENIMGNYGIIINLGTYKIDINPPVISNYEEVLEKTSINFKANFSDKHSGLKSIQIDFINDKNEVLDTFTTTTPYVDKTFTGLEPNTNYFIKYTAYDNAVSKDSGLNKSSTDIGNILSGTKNVKTLDNSSSGGGGDTDTDSNGGGVEPSQIPSVSEIVVTPGTSEIPKNTEIPVDSEVVQYTPKPTETPKSTITPSEDTLSNEDILPNVTPFVTVTTSTEQVKTIRVEKSLLNDNIYIILDENGVPLGFVELQPDEDINSIDILSRLQPLTDDIPVTTKANPKTGNDKNNTYFIIVLMATGIFYLKKKKTKNI